MKKGFTLIELLAVILILGIIALIAIPSVTKIIEESKKGAFKTTVQNLLSAAEKDCQLAQLRGEELNKAYTFKDGKIIEDKKLNIKGELPKSGTITVEDGCIVSATNLSDGTFIASKSVKSDNIEIVKAGEQASVQAAQYILANASSSELWDSPLEGDGYRYVGTNPDNYVCFGYTNVENDCDFSKAENTDKYAYRVIGIFEDDNGVKHVKLIKKEALNTNYAWNEENSDVNWDESDLYDKLNGDTFLTNTTYMATDWSDKIALWNYTMTNTLRYENDGPNYMDGLTVQNIYLHEMNRSSKTSTIGEWGTAQAKISLMYVSDYLLSLGSSALEYTSYTNKGTLKTGWMNISNNDTSATGEWTMARIGDDDGDYEAWDVQSSGYVHGGAVEPTCSARPVFYLTSDTTISGEGTVDNPFIVNK